MILTKSKTRKMMNELISLLYGFTAPLILGGYLPQIIKLYRSNDIASGVSLLMWFVWTLAAFISVLYAVIVLNDLMLILVSTANLSGCCIISVQIVLNKYRSTKKEYPY